MLKILAAAFAVIGLGVATPIAFLVHHSRASADCAKQADPIPSHEERLTIDTGFVEVRGPGTTPRVAFSQTIHVPGAQWLRLKFDEVQLAGDPAANGAVIRVVSMLDNAVQTLNAEQVEQWAQTSAYFNGDRLKVEILAYPGTGASRLAMSSITVGDIPEQSEPDSICGTTDDRTPLNDRRTARHMPEGCTAWVHNDLNSMMAMAGHCGGSAGDVEQFNVPLSNANGSIVNPPPQDQYPVDGASIQFQNGGVGQDWCYFGVFPNSVNGTTPFQSYGVRYVKSAAAPPVASPPQTIRITGYGTVSSPVSPTWNQYGKTHAGPYSQLTGTTVRYAVDTTGGNSGSPVHNLATDQVIGIHTHAGCNATGGSNQGTAIHHTGFQNALNNPLGVCRSGRNPISGPVYVSGDQVNNFGTANLANGQFGKVAEIPAPMQGLAFSSTDQLFYGCDTGRRLYRVDAAGQATLVGVFSTGSTINGLGFDPGANRLYGWAQSPGQLFAIDPATAATTAIGGSWGLTIGAIEYDHLAGRLYGLDDSGGATKLVAIDVGSGQPTTIGALGTGIADCNGLAYNELDGMLYTINAANDQLLRVNPATGAATVVGPTGGSFGAAFGMSARRETFVDVRPTFFQVLRGILLGGGLAELLVSDDQYLTVRGGPVASSTDKAVQILVEGNAPAGAASALRITVESAVSATPASSVQRTIHLFNFVTNTWEQVSSQASTAGDTTVEVVVTSNASRFIEPVTNRLRARMDFGQVGPIGAFPWQARVDLVKWGIAP